MPEWEIADDGWFCPTVAKLRAEKSLSSLDPYVIDVISSQNTRMDPGDAVALKHGKMSSTAIREWIVKHGKESEA